MDKISIIKDYFKVGCRVTFSKKVSESDINLFAELTGDFSPNHIDEEFMADTVYKKRIAHGALLVGYMSNVSSSILEKYPSKEVNATAVSLGYDRIRFIKPVFINDTITVSYTVDLIDSSKKRAFSKIEIRNQDDELVAVATHILKWVINIPE